MLLVRPATSCSACSLSAFTSSKIFPRSWAACSSVCRLPSEPRFSALHQLSFSSSPCCSRLSTSIISDTRSWTFLKSILPERNAMASSATLGEALPSSMPAAAANNELPCSPEATCRKEGAVCKTPAASSVRIFRVSWMACSSSFRVSVRNCQSCSCCWQVSLLSARSLVSSCSFLLLSSMASCLFTMSTLISPILVILASSSAARVAT
mmetsp:Transcript_31689/g.75574  ORF Transcript_31689/g.75574 Transcript_31689/m.75574 type:complete len:209 (+) Transcript_31689:703-1329(+)